MGNSKGVVPAGGAARRGIMREVTMKIHRTNSSNSTTFHVPKLIAAGGNALLKMCSIHCGDDMSLRRRVSVNLDHDASKKGA